MQDFVNQRGDEMLPILARGSQQHPRTDENDPVAGCGERDGGRAAPVLVTFDKDDHSQVPGDGEVQRGKVVGEGATSLILEFGQHGLATRRRETSRGLGEGTTQDRRCQ